jgi:hypothetical protein
MKPDTMPVFLHPIPHHSYYRAARAQRRQAIFWRVFWVAVPLVIITGSLMAVGS